MNESGVPQDGPGPSSYGARMAHVSEAGDAALACAREASEALRRLVPPEAAAEGQRLADRLRLVCPAASDMALGVMIMNTVTILTLAGPPGNPAGGITLQTVLGGAMYELTSSTTITSVPPPRTAA